MGAYEADFHRWTSEQAELLRAGRLAELDVEHLAEEIEALGRSEKRELVSRLRVLLLHLLKWQRQPSRRGVSWRLSIENARADIAEHLADNPSLAAQLEGAVATAYRHARADAVQETGLAPRVFPPSCPWSHQTFMADDFWPDDGP